MILKTKIEYREEDISKLTESDREKYTAKKAYLGDEFPEDELQISTIVREVVIDTDNGNLYVDMGEGKIKLQPLLSTDMIPYENDIVVYFNPTVVFEGTIDDIYNKLLEDKNINKN